MAGPSSEPCGGRHALDDRRRGLDALHEQIRRCVRCPLHATRRNAVPGEGPAGARVMFVGEAPGEKEDASGRPFAGRSGRFFERMLASIHLAREEVFITSSVKCHPPHNRNPQPEELLTCKAAWLVRQMELVGPGIVVALGRVAALQVTGRATMMMQSHGQVVDVEGTPCLLTFHPASGMRFSGPRDAMEEDFAALRRRLDELERQGGWR